MTDHPDAVKVLESVLQWAEARCPCENEEPNPCPLCGASVENLEPCKSAENTLPRHLLKELRSVKARAMQAAVPAPAGVRVKALHDIDWRSIFTSVFDHMRRGGESREMGARWMAEEADKAILSAIEDAGAREGAAEPLTMPVAHDPRFPSSGSTTKTIDGTLYNAPTPAGAGDLVERARAKAANMRLDDALSIGGAHDDGLLDALASRIEALEAEVAEARQIAEAERTALRRNKVAHEADLAALRAEVERLRQTEKSCQWYWPYGATESENCADSPQEVVQNAYGWEEPKGEIVAVARGGVVEVTYCAALPPAPDADSDDEFWVEEATEEAADAKITAELERRAALTPAKAGG